MEWHNMPIEGKWQGKWSEELGRPGWRKIHPELRRSLREEVIWPRTPAWSQAEAMNTSKNMIFKGDQWLQSTDPKRKEQTGSVPAAKVGGHSRPTDDWPRQTAKREVLPGGEMESILHGHGPVKSPKSHILVVVCSQLTPIPTLGTCESQNSP